MASKYWLKLYHDILDDPKMGTMPDRLWRRTIECFLAAGEGQNGGELPKLEDFAFRLRIHPEELETDLVEIQKTGILSSKNGTWYVTNFKTRQAKVSSTERTQRWRERRRKAGRYRDEDATKRPIEKKRIDIDIDTEKDIDKIVFCPKCQNKVLEEYLGQDCKLHTAKPLVHG